MDTSHALRATENSLRDVITHVLRSKLGNEWLNSAGISIDRLQAWKNRQAEEHRRLGRSDPRLIYYADFYDLRTLLRKKWSDGLSEIFECELKEIEILLKILEEYRNPDAHRRELLPYESNLVQGITGKIRSQISMYYNKMQDANSYFCRIETIQDNLGNSWSYSSREFNQPNQVLRPGQHLEVTVIGGDPQGKEVLYAAVANVPPFSFEWKDTGAFTFEITDSHISKEFVFSFAVKSRVRSYAATMHHVMGKCDQVQVLAYSVLPALEH